MNTDSERTDTKIGPYRSWKWIECGAVHGSARTINDVNDLSETAQYSTHLSIICHLNIDHSVLMCSLYGYTQLAGELWPFRRLD